MVSNTTHAGSQGRTLTYVAYEDRWPRYQVPARGDDAAEGRLYTEARADELTEVELADLSIADRAQADADLAAMDAAAAVGADDERAWRDHEHGGEYQPTAAE